MTPLPANVSDSELIDFIDRWCALMEAENYAGAFAFTEHQAAMHWTPQLICEVIKAYGDATPTQKVTVAGLPTDIRQRKNVSRWEPNARGCIGEIWYDLNTDGFVSDLTATFDIYQSPHGLVIRLDDIHVM
jgi:hypothetical protein